MKIKRGKLDIVLNMLCLIMLISTILFFIINWAKIPDKVPMSYDFTGNINRWVLKSELIILPVSTLILYIFMTIIENFPQVWNTGVKVTEENKEQVYSILLHLISTMKFIVVCVFMYLTVQAASGLKLSAWFLPIFILVIFGDLLYWIWRLVKVK